MILMREKRTSSRSRDHHGLFFMSKQRMCVWALSSEESPNIPKIDRIHLLSIFMSVRLTENLLLIHVPEW